jgi:methyl-accepting chemotaxis protein
MEAAGQETANNAQDISKAAETSVEISGDGLSVVRDSVSQFHSVRDQVQTIVSAVDKMNAQLSRIDAIIQSVSDVAKQSQLLAVNASIEAAKAGDAGLRFAVVAKEIKQMAVQSREATDSVRQTLGNVKKGIQNIAEVSEDGRRRTGRGMESIETTGKVITRLAEVINNTAQAARRISTNTQKQVDGLKEMSSSMFQIDDLSKGNLGAVRQIEAYGEKLNSKAKEMEKLVSKFRIG